MTFSCECYHVAVESLPEGVVVHFLGHLPDSEFCLDKGNLERAGQSGQTHLYVNCDALKSLGHPGVSELVWLGKVAHRWGGRAVLCRVPPHIQDILTLCRLEQFFDYRSETAPGSKLQWFNASWLTWNDSTVVKLAESIYQDRAFDRLPILADALEKAGCTNADILDHCRQSGQHVRGCWVVDLLLGKE
jgi:anti-anti-sigma regulatory factor